MKEERMKMILEMLENNPHDPFLIYAAALEYKKHQQTDLAITQLIQLTQTHPDYLASYYQLGKLLEENEQQEQAIEAYRKGVLVAKKQNDSKALSELSEALLLLDASE